MRAIFASLVLSLALHSSTASCQSGEPIDFKFRGTPYVGVTAPTWESVVAEGISRRQVKRAQAAIIVDQDRVIEAHKAKEKLLVEQVETARKLLKDCDQGYWEAVGEVNKLQAKKRRKNRAIVVLSFVCAGFVAYESVPLLSR